jgi:serine/threonine protein phosphatase PrpC/phosphoglycolate phosphatase-like HAD superfamily hydrolase/4'-phosphopantetheinyl transferase EntD
VSVTIPPHFPDWLTRWVVGHFPVGNPDAIRAAADAWARSAERLTVTLRHLERLEHDVAAAIQGQAGAAIQGQLKTQIANTRNQIEFANGMATLLYDSANAIELEQYIVIGIGAVLLANLLIDTAVPMKAASDRIAAEVAATTARRDTLAFLFQRAASFMERFPHMALAIRATIMGAVSMGGVVAGAQYAQIIQGHGKPGRRTSIDWGQVWVAAAAGGAGGLVGSLATRAVLPALTRIGANAATQAGRSTGRAVAVVLASATGGAAGGAAGAVTMSAITHAKLNLAQMILMGAGSGAVGGFGAAMRATRAMGAPMRPREETFTETGRSPSDASRDGLPVRDAPDWAGLRNSADAPPPHEETAPEIGGSRDGLPGRETIGGDAPWRRPHEDTVAEINKFDESYAEAFRKLDEGGTPPPSDPNQPPPGTPQAPPASPTSPGTSPAPSHGWGPWDDALKLLNEGGFEAAPADPIAASGSSSSTGLGTAQFQSSRPDSPQMGLAGKIVSAEGQPSATPGSVMTMSANTHAENNTHVGTAKDLGGTGNGPGVTAGPPVAHGGSPNGGGPGPHSNAPGHGPGELPPNPDEASILHLDFFDYEPVANEPATPAGTSPAATPQAASATPVEPVPGSGPGSTLSATSAEAKSPTAPVGASAGPGGTPATPTPTPVANAPQANPPQQPHANPQAAQANAPQPQAAQANPPQPHATPQGAQANSPQQPQAATPSPGAAANNSASQAIPPAALAGAAALSGHGPSNPDAVTGLSASPPAMSGGQPTGNDGTPSDPEEFPDRIGTVVTPPMPSYVPAQPQVDEFPNNAPDEYTKPQGTTYTIPGQPDAPDGPPPNAIPILPHPTTPALPETGPAIPLTDRPQVPIPDTAVPGAPAENDQDGQKPRVHDSEPPLPRHNNTPAPHLPATPADRPTELNPPSHYATTPNPETPGAPTDPTATPRLHRDSTQYIPDPTVQPTRGGTPATTLAGPLPQPVVPARPVPMASASADEPKKRRRKPNTPPPTPPQSADAPVGQQTNPTGDEQAVTGTIIPHEVKGMRGPNRTSVAGVVTRVDPASGPDSLVLHAVEARGPGHPDLRAAIGRPLTVGIEFDDLVVECLIWYRIHDDGRRQVWIAHDDPDVGNPQFEKVRRMIDAALVNRFPDALIEITEDFAGKIVQAKRVLGPTVPAETTSTADDQPGQADGEQRPLAEPGATPGDTVVADLLAVVDIGLLASVRESAVAERHAAVVSSRAAASEDVQRYHKLSRTIDQLGDLTDAMDQPEAVTPERLRLLVHLFHAEVERQAALADIATQRGGDVPHDIGDARHIREAASRAMAAAERYRVAADRVHTLQNALAAARLGAERSGSGGTTVGGTPGEDAHANPQGARLSEYTDTTDTEPAHTATDSGDPTDASDQPAALAGNSQVYHRLMAAIGNPLIARNLAAKVFARAAEEQPTDTEAATQRLFAIAENVLAEHRAAMAQLDGAVDNKPAPRKQQRLTPFQHAGLFFHNLPGNQPPTPENPDEASAPDTQHNPTPAANNENSTGTSSSDPASAENQPAAQKQPIGSESLLHLVRTNPYIGVRLGAEFFNDAGFEVMATVTSLYFMAHGGPGLAGAVGWATQLPYIGGALIAGHLTDHTPPKKLLMGSQALAATAGITATAALASGTSYSVPILIGTTLIGAAAAVLYNSAASKVLIEMVGDAQDGLTRFNNLRMNVTRVLGQGLGPMALQVGAWTAPVIDVSTSIVNLATLSRLPTSSTAPKPDESTKPDESKSTWVHLRESTAEGWRAVQNLPVRRRSNINLGLTNFYLGMQGLQFTSLIANSGLTEWQQGTALLITPLGGVIGNLIPKSWLEKTSIDTLLTARLAGLAGPAILQAITTSPWIASAGLAATWTVLGSTGIPVTTYVNKTTPSEVRGRVRAIGVVTTRGAFALGPAVAGGAIALLGHQTTGTSIAATFGTIAGWSLYQRLFKARKLLDSINQTSQATWALGLDTGIKPKWWQKSPEHLQRAIATQLVKIEFDPDTEDPVAQTIDAVRNLEDGADTAVLLLDDGKKMHSLTITNTDNKPGGNIVIFDTNITNPGDPHTDPNDPDRIPRVRTLDKWKQSHPDIEEAYVAFLTTDDEDNLTNRYPHKPDQETPRKDGKVLGPLQSPSDRPELQPQLPSETTDSTRTAHTQRPVVADSSTPAKPDTPDQPDPTPHDAATTRSAAGIVVPQPDTGSDPDDTKAEATHRDLDHTSESHGREPAPGQSQVEGQQPERPAPHTDSPHRDVRPAPDDGTQSAPPGPPEGPSVQAPSSDVVAPPVPEGMVRKLGFSTRGALELAARDGTIDLEPNVRANQTDPSPAQPSSTTGASENDSGTRSSGTSAAPAAGPDTAPVESGISKVALGQAFPHDVPSGDGRERVGVSPEWDAHTSDAEPRGSAFGPVQGLRDEGGRPVLGEPELAKWLTGETRSAAGVSMRGAFHHRNEDSMVAVESTLPDGKPCVVAAVFDGVGGAPDGHLASQEAADKLGADLKEKWSQAQFGRKLTREAVLQKALHDLQLEVQALGRRPEYADRKPQCTVVVVIVEPDLFTVGWVGDSRVGWASADGRHAMWWTEDHSPIRSIAKAEGITEREALEQHPLLEHAIEYALGGEGRIPAGPDEHGAAREYIKTIRVADGIDAPAIAEDGTITVPRGGVVVTVTDGVVKTMSDPRTLGEVVGRCAGDPVAIADAMVKRARDKGEPDDVTIVAVNHQLVGAEAPRTEAAAPLQKPRRRWWKQRRPLGPDPGPLHAVDRGLGPGAWAVGGDAESGKQAPATVADAPSASASTGSSAAAPAPESGDPTSPPQAPARGLLIGVADFDNPLGEVKGRKTLLPPVGELGVWKATGGGGAPGRGGKQPDLSRAAELPQQAAAPRETILMLRAGDPDAAAKTRAAIDEAVPAWPDAARAAAADTVCEVVADTVARTTVVDAMVMVEPRLGLRVTVDYPGRTELPRELVRTLELGATGWRAELWPNLRTIVCDFRRINDTVSVAARGTAEETVDDPVLNSQVLELVPHRESVSAAGRMVDDLLSRHARGVDLLEAIDLAENLARKATDVWRGHAVFTARISRLGLLTLEVVQDVEATGTQNSWGAVYRASGAPRTDLSTADGDTADTIVADVWQIAFREMVRNGWTDAGQLAAAEVVVLRRLSDFSAGIHGDQPWRFDVRVTGERGSKILTVTADPHDENPFLVVELNQSTAASDPNSPAAMGFYGNRWLVALHWSVATEAAANASDLFDGTDIYSRAEHLLEAGGGEVEALGQPAELVERVFAEVPDELVRDDARQAAISLAIELVDNLVLGPGGEALLTGAVTMGLRGLEFQVAVADRNPDARDRGGWQVQNLKAPRRASRVGVVPWGGGTITWAALELRPEAAGGGGAGRGGNGGGSGSRGPSTGGPSTVDVLDTIAHTLGEDRPTVGTGDESTPAQQGRGVAEVLDDVNDVLSEQSQPPRGATSEAQPSTDTAGGTALDAGTRDNVTSVVARRPSLESGAGAPAHVAADRGDQPASLTAEGADRQNDSATSSSGKPEAVVRPGDKPSAATGSAPGSAGRPGSGVVGPPHGAVEGFHGFDQDEALDRPQRGTAAWSHVPGDPMWAMGFNQNPNDGQPWDAGEEPHRQEDKKPSGPEDDPAPQNNPDDSPDEPEPAHNHDDQPEATGGGRDAARADVAARVGVALELLLGRPEVLVNAIDRIQNPLRCLSEQDWTRMRGRKELLPWVGRQTLLGVEIADALARMADPMTRMAANDEWRLLLNRQKHLRSELAELLGLPELSTESPDPVSVDLLFELRRLSEQAGSAPEIAGLVESASRFLELEFGGVDELIARLNRPLGSRSIDPGVVELPSSADCELAEHALHKAKPGATASWLTRPEDARRRSVSGEIANWWHALSWAEQQALVKVYPREVGSRDVFPLWAVNEANERTLKLLMESLGTRPPEDLSVAERQQLRYAARLWDGLVAAERRANAGNGVFAVPLLSFDPTALVSRVGLELLAPGVKSARFWHVRVGPDDTSWLDQLFEPGPAADAMVVFPGRRTGHYVFDLTGHSVFELTVGPRGADGVRLTPAEAAHAASVAGDGMAEWLRRLAAWCSDEQIEIVRSGVAKLVERSLADSTGEVRVAARRSSGYHGERVLILEVIDNNPESPAVEEFTAARKVDDAGVVQLEGSKGTWLAFGESMIRPLLPPGVYGYELLGEQRIRGMGGEDPGFMCGRLVLGRAGISESAAPGFQEKHRPYPGPLPWPDGVVGAITPQGEPDNYAAGMVARGGYRALGFGVGMNERFSTEPGSEAEQKAFVDAKEWAWLQDVGDHRLAHDGIYLERLFLVVKDAVGEALDALLPQEIRPRSIHVTFDLAARTFQARLDTDGLAFFGPPVEVVSGGFNVRDGVVLAVAWVPQKGDADRAGADVEPAAAAPAAPAPPGDGDGPPGPPDDPSAPARPRDVVAPPEPEASTGAAPPTAGDQPVMAPHAPADRPGPPPETKTEPPTTESSPTSPKSPIAQADQRSTEDAPGHPGGVGARSAAGRGATTADPDALEEVVDAGPGDVDGAAASAPTGSPWSAVQDRFGGKGLGPGDNSPPSHPRGGRRTQPESTGGARSEAGDDDSPPKTPWSSHRSSTTTTVDEALGLPRRPQRLRGPRGLDVWFAADPDIPPEAGAHASGSQKLAELDVNLLRGSVPELYVAGAHETGSMPQLIRPGSRPDGNRGVVAEFLANGYVAHGSYRPHPLLVPQLPLEFATWLGTSKADERAFGTSEINRALFFALCVWPGNSSGGCQHRSPDGTENIETFVLGRADRETVTSPQHRGYVLIFPADQFRRAHAPRLYVTDRPLVPVAIVEVTAKAWTGPPLATLPSTPRRTHDKFGYQHDDAELARTVDRPRRAPELSLGSLRGPDLSKVSDTGESEQVMLYRSTTTGPPQRSACADGGHVRTPWGDWDPEWSPHLEWRRTRDLTGWEPGSTQPLPLGEPLERLPERPMPQHPLWLPGEPPPPWPGNQASQHDRIPRLVVPRRTRLEGRPEALPKPWSRSDAAARSNENAPAGDETTDPRSMPRKQRSVPTPWQQARSDMAKPHALDESTNTVDENDEPGVQPSPVPPEDTSEIRPDDLRQSLKETGSDGEVTVRAHWSTTTPHEQVGNTPANPGVATAAGLGPALTELRERVLGNYRTIGDETRPPTPPSEPQVRQPQNDAPEMHDNPEAGDKTGTTTLDAGKSTWFELHQRRGDEPVPAPLAEDAGPAATHTAYFAMEFGGAEHANELDSAEELRAVLDGLVCVQLDFDGPVVDLFKNLSAAKICKELLEILERAGVPIRQEVAETSDFLKVLIYAAEVNDDYPGRELARRVEERLTELEIAAARLAGEPTPGVRKLLEVFKPLGIPVIIVTNNDEDAANLYLAIHGLEDLVSGVVGRPRLKVALLKPNPYSLLQAIARAGNLKRGVVVMIGDSESDYLAAVALAAALEAAEELDVRAILYANKPRKRNEFPRLGAGAVVTDMGNIAEALKSVGKVGPRATVTNPAGAGDQPQARPRQSTPTNPKQDGTAPRGHRGWVPDNPAGFGLDVPARKAGDIGGLAVPPPAGQRFDPGRVHAVGPNVGPDGWAVGQPGPRASTGSGLTGSGRETPSAGSIRIVPAGLIVPADPTSSLIVPAAHVMPADPTLEELMEELLPYKKSFWYFWSLERAREGELSGRAWLESEERKDWMRRRANLRTPLYKALGVAIRLTLAAEIWLKAPNATPGPLRLKQRRVIPGRGEIDVWKYRTMPYGTPVGESSPANADLKPPFARALAAVSGDELPQTDQIRDGNLSFVGGRVVRAQGHNLMVAGRYAEGYYLMGVEHDPVLTPQEYALWLSLNGGDGLNGHDGLYGQDALWGVHYPASRDFPSQSPEFLRHRYLTYVIFTKIACKRWEQQYLDLVVGPHLRRTGVVAGRVLLHDLSHYLPKSCRSTMERLGVWGLKGLGRRVGAEVKDHLDNCEACRNTAAALTEVDSSLGGRSLIVPPGPAGDGATEYQPAQPTRAGKVERSPQPGDVGGAGSVSGRDVNTITESTGAQHDSMSISSTDTAGRTAGSDAPPAPQSAPGTPRAEPVPISEAPHAAADRNDQPAPPDDSPAHQSTPAKPGAARPKPITPWSGPTTSSPSQSKPSTPWADRRTVSNFGEEALPVNPNTTQPGEGESRQSAPAHADSRPDDARPFVGPGQAEGLADPTVASPAESEAPLPSSPGDGRDSTPTASRSDGGRPAPSGPGVRADFENEGMDPVTDGGQGPSAQPTSEPPTVVGDSDVGVGAHAQERPGVGQEVTQRIGDLQTRLTEITATSARFLREGKAFPADRMNPAITQIRAEIARLTTTGTLRDDVPIAAGPDPQMAVASVFRPEPVYLWALDQARSAIDSYLVDRVAQQLTTDDVRDRLSAINAAINRVSEVAHETDQLDELDKLKTDAIVLEWTDQAGTGERPRPVPKDSTDTPDSTDTRDEPEVQITTQRKIMQSPIPPRKTPKSVARRRLQGGIGHEARLPRTVSLVAEPAETADLGEISRLYAGQMPDDRIVHFRFLGDPEGYPVFMSPGTPVGVDGVPPDAEVLAALGFSVIIVERPGYGDSTPMPGRTVADCSRDIIHIAKWFRFDQYSVVGRSGGGPPAIGVGALDPHVDRVIALVTTTPMLGNMQDWSAPMTAGSNSRVYNNPTVAAMAAELTDRAKKIARDGRWLIRLLESDFTTSDHMWVGAHRDALARGYQRAFRKHPEVWSHDAIQITQDWGFEFDGYPVPLSIVHGTLDQFSPVEHALKNAALFANAELHLLHNVSHMTCMDPTAAIEKYLRRERDEYWRLRDPKRLTEIQAIGRPPIPPWANRIGRWDLDLTI